MKIYTLILAFAFFAVFQSCKTPKEFSELTKDDVLISMTTGACYGSCPIYTLSIYKGGFAHFDGERFTKKEGTWLKKINKKQFDSIVEAFEKSNYTSFQDEYESELADLPTISISYKSKTVRGKDGRPAEVVDLQSMLYKIVKEEEGWKTYGQTEKSLEKEGMKKVMSKPQYNYKEIIVEPQKGHPLSRILAKYRTDYGLRLLKKISPNTNLWLVSYDKSKIEAKKMIEILKREEGIKTASFNLLTQDR